VRTLSKANSDTLKGVKKTPLYITQAGSELVDNKEITTK